MPAYNANPLALMLQLVPGVPAYLLGSLNRLVAPTVMTVTSVALSGTTATIGVKVKEGNLPVVGQKVTLTGAVPAYFNVTAATITAVSFTNTPEDGIGTIQFSLTNSNIGTTVSPGLAVAPQIDTGEALFAGSSIACALQANTGPENGRVLRADVTFPTLPGAATVDLQSAPLGTIDDSAFTTLATVATVTGGVYSNQALIQSYINPCLLRFNVHDIAGGASAKIVGKLTV